MLRMSSRGNIVTVAISCLLLVLVACGDDDIDFATRPSDGSSSSVTPKNVTLSEVEGSSDSETSVSSSSSAKADGGEYDAIANTLKDLRDGQTYRIVKIGDQVWMAENLNYETDNSFCYNDSAEYCDKYGRLYTWAAAMDSAGIWSTNGKGCGYGNTCSVASKASATLVRGVCPEGWHLPTQTEWKNLFTAVGGSSVAGIKLKSTSGWNSNGSDTFSFSGHRYNDGRYASEGDRADFWSSSEYNSDYAYSMHLYYNDDGVSLVGNPKDYGHSIRCVQD